MTQKLLLSSLAVSDTCQKVEKDCVSVFFFSQLNKMWVFDFPC